MVRARTALCTCDRNSSFHRSLFKKFMKTRNARTYSRRVSVITNKNSEKYKDDRASLSRNHRLTSSKLYRIRTVIVVSVLVVGTKTAARSFEVVAIVTATSSRTLQGVLVVQVQVVRESVVSRAGRRPLLVGLLFLEIKPSKRSFSTLWLDRW